MTYLLDPFGSEWEPTQREPILGTGQTRNNADGYGWTVDDFTRLDRFLILGSEGGTYYQKQRALTTENAEAVMRCLWVDPERTLNRITDVSVRGVAPKNDPALFALALATLSTFSVETRQVALYDCLPQVARTGTHLLHFIAYVQSMRGWSRSLRTGVSKWFLDKEPRALAYQAVKYQSRDDWALRDLLRLAHPKPKGGWENSGTDAQQIIVDWIAHGWPEVGDIPHPQGTVGLIWAYEQLKKAETETQVVRLIEEYNCPRETVPSQWLHSPRVWQALLDRMPMGAMLRNLATMTKVGLVSDHSAATQLISDRLTDQERIFRSRLHPLKLLVAHLTYAQGHGFKSDAMWTPAAAISDATQDAFYLAFGNVPATNKRTLLCLDISDSMRTSKIAGMPFLSAREASAALALVTANVEPSYGMCAFSTELAQVFINPQMRLADAVQAVSHYPHGGTDCSLPILKALEHEAPVDTFIIYTDNETWAGRVHPSRALQMYRQKVGVDAKLITVGMTSGEFSIADPNDAGMLDVVGFGTDTPNIISWFAGNQELTALPLSSTVAPAASEVEEKVSE